MIVNQNQGGENEPESKNKQGVETYLKQPGALDAVTSQKSTTCRQAHQNSTRPPHQIGKARPTRPVSNN